MAVKDVIDGMPVEPNHVYVIPPNTALTIENRVLKLSAREQEVPHLPIDNFLRSLARDDGPRAIGVILSGAGSDGSLGLQAIKEAGGVTLVQEPATAEFPSMPKLADAAANADFVLAPEEIGVELGRIASHPHYGVAERSEQRSSPADRATLFHTIVTIMHEATGIDFSLYKESTVHRRILRRLALRHILTLEEYATHLTADRDERSALEQDLLISVTGFFREPESFEALQNLVFPAIVQDRPGGLAIRIWVPGCATGEEAYSIAISLQEYLTESGHAFPVQIFASDISKAAIEQARSGRYGNNIKADVSADRLSRFFTIVNGGYQISKPLRDMCVFSRHNLIEDPPFSKLDLISCRNVLIYLGSVQKNIIPMFHYALREPGFLLLGRSETVHFDELFSHVGSNQRIYAKRHMEKESYGSYAHVGKPLRKVDKEGNPLAAPVIGLWDGIDIGRGVDRILLSKYDPVAVLVDDVMEVLEIRGHAAPFLQLPTGRVSLNLTKLIPDTGLFLAVEKLVHEAASSGQAVRQEAVAYESTGYVREVNIEVTPLLGKQRKAQLIIFEHVQTVSKPMETPFKGREAAVDGRDRLIEKLTQDLEQARQRLVSMAEDHQISEEEDQTEVEEAQSASEELQSLNEELETAKEELQSTNEELITLNRELEARNVVLVDAEQALRRSEARKTEAVGRLAGGIAHDFGNALASITTYSALVADSLGEGHEALEYVREIENSVKGAATLTDQLLAAGLKKVLQPKVFDLNRLITDCARSMRPLVGEQTRIETRLAADLWRVKADRDEIERAATNLCLNARDAMPGGGTLTVSTVNVTLDETDAHNRNLSPNRYVRMEVSDIGVGMSPETRAHIFEPFFTTKEIGKGTGLGLAMTLGIIEQSGGAIWCDSELGRGSTFNILLPAVVQVSDQAERPAGRPVEAPSDNSEVILLVEDEDSVRKPARKFLETRGYTVLEAKDGIEGLAVCESHKGNIDLLVSDVMLPGLGGRQLADRVCMIRPGLKVLFMSAHTEDTVLKEGIRKGTPFLKKPFSGTELARSVREVLDATHVYERSAGQD